MKQVEIDKIQCQKIGEIVKNLKFRSDFYNRKFLKLKASKEIIVLTYLFASAICHQTHTLWNSKLNLKGWDYLEYIFGQLAEENSELLDIEYLNSLSTKKLSGEFKKLFSENGESKNCTLDRIDERSDFILDIARVLDKKYQGKISNLIKLSNGYLVNKNSGLYELLKDFKAFQDPTFKKSTIFIKLLSESGLIKIKDPKNFVPAMDYHIQRVMLRMGCVEILDEKLKKTLINKEKIKSDNEIRDACIEANKIIAQKSGYSICQMDDFFWPLGRSCCKEFLLCRDHKCNKKPCTFELAIDLKSHKNCVFAGTCQASINPEYQKFWQPQVDTNFY